MWRSAILEHKCPIRMNEIREKMPIFVFLTRKQERRKKNCLNSIRIQLNSSEMLTNITIKSSQHEIAAKQVSFIFQVKHSLSNFFTMFKSNRKKSIRMQKNEISFFSYSIKIDERKREKKMKNEIHKSAEYFVNSLLC